MSEIDPQNERGLGSAMADALDDVGTKVADMKLVARAVRNGWPIPEGKRAILVEKLTKIAEAEETTIITDEGKAVQVSNARNQTAAARTLVAMDSLNQTDYWNADKNARIDAGQATERVALDPVILRQPVKPE